MRGALQHRCDARATISRSQLWRAHQLRAHSTAADEPGAVTASRPDGALRGAHDDFSRRETGEDVLQDHVDHVDRDAAGRHAVARDLLLVQRSEEHTSELQSRLHLVCRLLLEKKKKNKIMTRPSAHRT